MAWEALGQIRSPISGTDTISRRSDCYGCTSDRIVEATLPRLSLADVRWAVAHLAGQLILALAQIDDMPEQPFRGPFHVGNFHDHLRSDPMDAAKHQW